MALERLRTQRMSWSGDVLVILIMASVAFVTQSRGSSFAIDVATEFGLLTILVGSLQLMLGYTNQASLAQAALYGLGAYTSAYLEITYHVPVVIALLSAIGAGLVCGLLVAIPLVRLHEHFLALGTLALQMIGSTLATHLISITGGPSGDPVPIAHVNSIGLVYVVLALGAVVVLGLRRMKFTRMGRRLLAVKTDETMAASNGVNVALARVSVIVVGFALASGAGFLFGMSAGFIAPSDFSLTFSLVILVAMIVGGRSLTWGTLVGAGAYSILQVESTGFPGLYELILGIFLVVVLAYFPWGLTGISWDLIRRFASRSGSTGLDLAFEEARDPFSSDVQSFDLQSVEGEQLHGAGVNSPEDGYAQEYKFSYRDEIASSASGGGDSGASDGSRSGGGRSPDVSAPRAEGPVLEVDGIVKRFGGVEVLANVTLSIANPGDICAILGQNGAGKTTLLNIITGIVRPDAGTVKVGGDAITGKRPWKITDFGIARSFQNPRLLLEESCLENVLVGDAGRRGVIDSLATLRHHGTSARASAREALRLTGLANAESELAGSLPYGARKVLEIARCLAIEPRLLLLDEPGAGLSEEEELWLAGVLASLAARGITILLIEHRMRLVSMVARRVVMLDSGVIVFDGPTDAALASPIVKERYLGKELANVGSSSGDGVLEG